MNVLSILTAIFISISIVLLGYTSYWYIAAEKIKNQVTELQQKQILENREFIYTKMTIKGFPLKFETVFENPKLKILNSDLEINTNKLIFSLRPWDYSTITITPKNRTSALLTKGEVKENYSALLGSGIIKIRLENGLFKIFDVTISNLELSSPFSQEAITLSQLSAYVDVSGIEDYSGLENKTVKSYLNIENVGIPDNFGIEMGRYVEYFQLSASIFGKISNGNIKNITQNWRDSGGTIEIDDLQGRWGPLELNANGTLALDSKMRPLASLTSSVVGYGDMIDALIMSNAIPFGDAFLAKVAFNMLAEEEKDGGPRVLRNVPLTIQDGILSVGTMEVGEIKPLHFY